MSDEVDKLSELEQKLFDAAEKAVAELIKVAEAPIIKGKHALNMDDDVAVEKMKNAASAKKTAMFDAFDIIDKTRERRSKVEKANSPSENDTKSSEIDFAEGRAQ